ncbi:MAG: hypothetical protein LBC41_03570 [Clostridiales bacterium]|jgi:hypothetical protein|nr:hypothetical protein [Clostridiales bacterium]MDR2749720.1 hypothetical protein [Clostridiales bacterium]
MLSSRKKALSIATAVLLICISVTGTFTWTQFISQSNEFIGTAAITGDIILHDDFDPSTGQKEIYVETSALSKKVYVRVLLAEYMDLLTNSKPSDLDSPDKRLDYYKNHFHAGMLNAEDCGQANDDGQLFHDYFNWNLGGSKFYYTATSGNALDIDTDPASQVFGDTTRYTEESQYVKSTPDAEILSLDEYNSRTDEDKNNTAAWVYDNDGYAYWSQPLGAPVAGTAIGPVTGLLLNKVSTSPDLADTDYYYVINIRVEAVDSKDLPMWTEDSGSMDSNLGVPLGAEAASGSGARYPLASYDAVQLLDYVSKIGTAPVEALPAIEE